MFGVGGRKLARDILNTQFLPEAAAIRPRCSLKGIVLQIANLFLNLVPFFRVGYVLAEKAA